MSKIIDFSKNVHVLCNEDPEIMEIMKTLGFKDIAEPGMLDTVGRFMTIPKGARIKGIEMDTIKGEFTKRGYTIKE